MPYASAQSESAFVVRCLDSIIPLVSIFEFSSLYLVSVAAQTNLSLTWSETPKTGFLMTRLIISNRFNKIVIKLMIQGQNLLHDHFNVMFLTSDNEFSGIIYGLFRGRQNIFLTIFSTKFVVKCATKILKIS